MRPIIDAHVHLMPARLEGTVDERYGIKMDAYGCKVLPGGFPAAFLPNYMEKSSFSKEALIHVMDCSDVERAVIMQSLCFKINEDVAEAVQIYPERLRGAMAIEPKDESVLDEIRYWYRQGLTVIKFEMSEPFGYTNPNAYPDLDFDSPLMNKVYDLAGELGVTVTIDTSPVGTKGFQEENLHRAVRKHPNTKFVICHLAFPWVHMENDGEKQARWIRMTDLAQYSNVWFDIAALCAIFREEEYPYTAATDILRSFMDRYSAEKVIWGSDIPGTYVDATYQQMVHMFTKCGKFTDEELEAMFRENALKVYFGE